MPSLIAVRKGANSTCSSTSAVRETTGRTAWESSPALPWPGKCLPTASTPASASPLAAIAPSWPTRRGSSPNERTPITGLRGLSLTSSTGAKFVLMPQATSSLPSAKYTRRTTSGSPSPVLAAANAMALGQRGVPLVCRDTGPPSWSVAKSKGQPDGDDSASLCRLAESVRTSASLPKLRLK
ncbi:MAG: hypothetical protein DDT39_01554 [Firmicutes bacterium]|nr:hypothetical protein [candidate division NPL-UPA2 bacterium]